MYEDYCQRLLANAELGELLQFYGMETEDLFLSRFAFAHLQKSYIEAMGKNDLVAVQHFEELLEGSLKRLPLNEEVDDIMAIIRHAAASATLDDTFLTTEIMQKIFGQLARDYDVGKLSNDQLHGTFAAEYALLDAHMRYQTERAHPELCALANIDCDGRFAAMQRLRDAVQQAYVASGLVSNQDEAKSAVQAIGHSMHQAVMRQFNTAHHTSYKAVEITR